MIIRQNGGMTEFIPSPGEKRDGLIRNHVLELLVNLHDRITRLEAPCDLPNDPAQEFLLIMDRIRQEEIENQHIHNALIL